MYLYCIFECHIFVTFVIYYSFLLVINLLIFYTKYIERTTKKIMSMKNIYIQIYYLCGCCSVPGLLNAVYYKNAVVLNMEAGISAETWGINCYSTQDNDTEMYYFNTMYRAYTFFILYSDQQMHTIIPQIITLLLHVSTLSCHPQGSCNCYLSNLHKYFKCSCWQYDLQFITLIPHVSTQLCHPQEACNQ